MMKYKFGILLVGLFLFVFSATAQRATQLRINEVMVKNMNNFQDDYGIQSPWIEIFNSAYATVNIGGCYLSNDVANLKKYMIPKGDVLTKIKPRQHTLFWADNEPTRGTFHLNFTLDTVKVNTLYLVDSNGKDIIDSIFVKWNGDANTSFGRCADGKDFVKNDSTGELESAWKTLSVITPSTNNTITTDKEHQAVLQKQFPNGIGNAIMSTGAANEKFETNDPLGVGMSATAMFVVFIGLVILFLMFKLIGYISIQLKQRRMMKSGIDSTKAQELLDNESGEIYAAIAMALYAVENEDHDWEDTVLTINKVAKTYSPWSSKIYGLREMPNKN
ncbi:MAG: OadG family transporter subunit [Bacteroidales bacterium]|nr:OadG family transporter subunit [Bacteroidales bacterium]